MFGGYHGLSRNLVFVCAYMKSSRGLAWSPLAMVAEAPCLRLVLCDLTPVQQENMAEP